MPHRCPVTFDCQGTGVDAEWPLIMNRFPELRLGYILCEGLEFEMADRYQKEIAQAWGAGALAGDTIGAARTVGPPPARGL